MKNTMVNASCQTDTEVVVIDKQYWDDLQQQKTVLEAEVERLQEVVNRVQLMMHMSWSYILVSVHGVCGALF